MFKCYTLNGSQVMKQLDIVYLLSLRQFLLKNYIPRPSYGQTPNFIQIGYGKWAWKCPVSSDDILSEAFTTI